jgi:hypothetical protein
MLRTATAFRLLGIVPMLTVSSLAVAQQPKDWYCCTNAQLNTPEADVCLALQQDDVFYNWPTTHVLYCSGSGRLYCCEADNAGGGLLRSRACHPQRG